MEGGGQAARGVEGLSSNIRSYEGASNAMPGLDLALQHTLRRASPGARLEAGTTRTLVRKRADDVKPDAGVATTAGQGDKGERVARHAAHCVPWFSGGKRITHEAKLREVAAA